MSAWDSYLARASVRGMTRRESSKIREQRYLTKHLPESLSYHTATIVDTTQLRPGINRKYCPCEVHEQNVAIINTDNLDKKTIISLPGETLRHGDVVEWMDQHWLIIEKDYNTELYTKCKMQQCNYLLRWINEIGEIFEEWCIVEDGTKLKHITLCNSLVYWKRYAKRIPLIAGNPLEPHSLQRGFETMTSAIA